MQQTSTKPGRREPRFPLHMPILVFGYDRLGRGFMEQAQTLDISIAGARLTGLSSEVFRASFLPSSKATGARAFRCCGWASQCRTRRTHRPAMRRDRRTHPQTYFVHRGQPGRRGFQRSYLETAGYEFVCCGRVAPRQAVFQESAFDLLMADVQSGRDELGDFISFVRRNSPRTRVLLLSQ